MSMSLFGKTQYQFHIGAKIYQTLRSLAAPRYFNVVTKAPRVGVPVEERPQGVTGLLAEDVKKYFLKIALDVAVKFNSVPKHNFCVMYGHKYILRQPLPLQAKTHRRVVFKEECQCFDKLSNYADVTLGMAQLVRGLEYMCLAGYLHHDISLGNCLFLVSQRQLKISNLEFARPYNAPYTEEGFTGTPGFMAVKYEKGMHSFDKTKENPAREPFFRYNFVHDLEAALTVWWYCNQLVMGGSSDRCGFVTDAAIAELYEQVPEGAVLVAGLSCFDVLKRMYQDIEATQPLDPDRPCKGAREEDNVEEDKDKVEKNKDKVEENKVEENKVEEVEEVNDDMKGDNDDMKGDNAEMEEDKEDIDNPSKIRHHLFRLPTPQGVEVV
ncbi:hypothetical protein CPB85DRAFT_1259550 [Mucidula mucida]|nr:hypothetical protein CPB85DRAFT_1259550 [Mucidula mucida]